MFSPQLSSVGVSKTTHCTLRSCYNVDFHHNLLPEETVPWITAFLSVQNRIIESSHCLSLGSCLWLLRKKNNNQQDMDGRRTCWVCFLAKGAHHEAEDISSLLPYSLVPLLSPHYCTVHWFATIGPHILPVSAQLRPSPTQPPHLPVLYPSLSLFLTKPKNTAFHNCKH